jgi:hypothetical protein
LEKQTEKDLLAMGWTAKRMPLSGGAAGFEGDVLVDGFGRIECKSRKGGFKFFYDNIELNMGLVVKRDRDEPLFVCRLGDLDKLTNARKGQ